MPRELTKEQAGQVQNTREPLPLWRQYDNTAYAGKKYRDFMARRLEAKIKYALEWWRSEMGVDDSIDNQDVGKFGIQYLNLRSRTLRAWISNNVYFIDQIEYHLQSDTKFPRIGPSFTTETQLALARWYAIPDRDSIGIQV